MKHLLEIDDLTPTELAHILSLSADDVSDADIGGGMALIFEMPSARTRNAAEMAAVQLGMHPVYITGAELGLDQRESVEDVVRTLACYHSIVGARLHNHHMLERMSAVDVVPVVNLLSSEAHPLQALADIATIRDEFAEIDGRTIAFLGAPNNVWRSLCMAAGMVGMSVSLAVPESHLPSEDDLARIKRCGGDVTVTTDPIEAVSGADVVYTDKWVSMSDGEDAKKGAHVFYDYSVTTELMAQASDEAIFLHCLPAKRGEEVVSEVIDGHWSRVWAQATNRMKTTRGVVSWLLD